MKSNSGVQFGFKKKRYCSSRRKEAHFEKANGTEPPYAGCYGFLNRSCLVWVLSARLFHLRRRHAEELCACGGAQAGR